jgi:hypothetical protein
MPDVAKYIFGKDTEKTIYGHDYAVTRDTKYVYFYVDELEHFQVPIDKMSLLANILALTTREIRIHDDNTLSGSYLNGVYKSKGSDDEIFKPSENETKEISFDGPADASQIMK